MRKLVLLTSYLMLLPLFVLSLTLFSLFFIFSPNIGKVKGASVSYQATPDTNPGAVHGPQTKESRVERLENFLGRLNSPLEKHAGFIVETADKYELDWRLVTAIAMTESTACKNEPGKSRNCWGYGVHGGKVRYFNTYEDAIEEVSRSLAETYRGLGLVDPHEIVTRYNPGSTTWAGKVELFMDQIQASL